MAGSIERCCCVGLLCGVAVGQELSASTQDDMLLTCSIHAVLRHCVGSCLAPLGCQIGSTRLGFYLGVLLFRFLLVLSGGRAAR